MNDDFRFCKSNRRLTVTFGIATRLLVYAGETVLLLPSVFLTFWTHYVLRLENAILSITVSLNLLTQK